MGCIWKKDPAWNLGTYQFDDPIQGVSPNCAVIAALSSVASVVPINAYYKNKLTINLSSSYVDNGVNVNVYKVEFYPATQSIPCLLTGASQPVYVTDHLYYDSDFCWGKSKTLNEIWVGVYEKAFAAFKLGQNGSAQNPVATPTTAAWNPSGAYINWGNNPAMALSAITNKCNKQKNTVGNSQTQIWTDLSGCCTICTGYAYNYRASRPTVAWTGTSINGGNLPFDGDVSATHSYSVVGLLNTSSYPKHIVLRNPIGRTFGDTVVSGTDLNCCGNPLSNGLWAIPLSDFQNRFSHYGWVQ